MILNCHRILQVYVIKVSCNLIIRAVGTLVVEIFFTLPRDFEKLCDQKVMRHYR